MFVSSNNLGNASQFIHQERKNTPESVIEHFPVRLDEGVNETSSQIGLNCIQKLGHWLKKTRLFQAIRNIFQRIFFPNLYKARMEKYTRKTIELTTNRVNQSYLRDQSDIAAQIGELGLDGGPYRVREYNFLSEGKRNLKYSIRNQISEAAYEFTEENAIPLLTNGRVTLTPNRMIHENVETGRIFPSAILHLERKSAIEKDHLSNCYTSSLVGKPHIIRSGVINSEQKAKELIQVIHFIDNDDNIDARIRLVSHQLNSPERERSLIENQHAELLKLNNESMQIAHINTPANRFFEYTQMIRKIPGGRRIEKLIFKGEIASKKQNLEGWLQYFLWLSEDINGLSHPATLKEIQDVINEFSNTQSIGDKKTVEAERKILRGHLTRIYDYLSGISNREIILNNEDMRKINLFRSILAEQLDIKGRVPMSRGAELMAIQFLNDELGAISAINCKTGTDRTAFLHAVKISMQEMEADELYEMIHHWDEETKKMNKWVKKYGWEKFNLAMQGDPDWQRINLFRQRVLHNLLNFGLPITAFSTGLIGLKWNEGLSENRHPLNFIPPYVEVVGENGDAEPRLVQIVRYDANGRIMGLTEKGRQLLTQQSPFREA